MKYFTLLLSLSLVYISSNAQAPTISSFTPTSAATGTTISIKGTHFLSANSVLFGGTAAASFTILTDTTMTAVVASGTSGSLQVINLGGTASKTGFYYITTSRIITDYHGYWSATTANPNPLTIDSSHNLLAFTYNGTMYSTGVNNTILTSNGISFVPGKYRALPVAGIAGVTATTANSTYIALAKKVDGSAAVANTPAVDHLSVKDVLVDGIQGLDLGTGVTNLPSTAVLTFQIFNIDPARVADNEPDIILTQIAQPVSGNDIYTLLDAAGTVIGTTVSQDMILLPKLGSYDLDLFNLVPGTPYNVATAYSAFTANTNREIRVVGLRLSDFGITLANVAQVRSLKITPSGNSDYAFIAYNANAINIPPNISVNDAQTNETVCAGGTSHLAVVATPAVGGTIAYSWEVSTNGGTVWTAITNGGKYTGAFTEELIITNPTNNYKYRSIITETGNSATGTSPVFTITINNPAAPTAVTISGNVTTCLNNAVQLTSAVTGGSNLFYQWQKDIAGTYADITDATFNTYVPAVDLTGSFKYQLRVTSGNGCPAAMTSAAPSIVTVTGISSVAPASVCSSGPVTLAATATSGTIDWYTVETGGLPLATGNTYTTPTLNTTAIYYAVSSGCATALRVPVTAAVYPTTAGGTITGSNAVTMVINSNTLTLNSAVGNVNKWQSSTDNFTSVINDIPATAGAYTYTANNITQSMYYRAQLQSGVCGMAYSSIGVLSVSGTLAINNTSLHATRSGETIQVRFTASEQDNTLYFDVERSADGVHFYSIITITPATTGTSTYTYSDLSPITGNNFYRISEHKRNGSTAVSIAVMVRFTNSAFIQLYPTLITGNKVTLSFTNCTPGKYQVAIIGSTGQLINKFIITHNRGISTQTLILPQLLAGVYNISIKGDAINDIFKVVVY